MGDIQDILNRANAMLRSLSPGEMPTQEVVDRGGAAFMKEVARVAPFLREVRIVPIETPAAESCSIEVR